MFFHKLHYQITWSHATAPLVLLNQQWAEEKYRGLESEGEQLIVPGYKFFSLENIYIFSHTTIMFQC